MASEASCHPSYLCGSFLTLKIVCRNFWWAYVRSTAQQCHYLRHNFPQAWPGCLGGQNSLYPSSLNKSTLVKNLSKTYLGLGQPREGSILHSWQPTPATHPLISIWPGISILGHIVGNSSNPIHKPLPTPHSILRLRAIKSLCEFTKITRGVIPPSTGHFRILGKYSMSLSQVPHMWNGSHYHAYSLGLFWEINELIYINCLE